MTVIFFEMNPSKVIGQAVNRFISEKMAGIEQANLGMCFPPLMQIIPLCSIESEQQQYQLK